MSDAKELLYKVEYERYLHHRIESKLARSAKTLRPLQSAPTPRCPHIRTGEMLEARYHETLSRMLLPSSPLVPTSHATPHWRESCAMDTSDTSTCKPQPHPITPLMDISISRQVDCKKRGLGSAQQRECSSSKRTRGLQQGEWM